MKLPQTIDDLFVINDLILHRKIDAYLNPTRTEKTDAFAAQRWRDTKDDIQRLVNNIMRNAEDEGVIFT